MKCPACYNELTEVLVGTVLVDVCQCGCGGVWLDPFELEKVDEKSEPGETLFDVVRDDALKVDLQKKRECPRCPGIKLHRHFFSAKRQVQVDQCPNCGGYWLDAGELAQIRAERTDLITSAKAGESTISSEFIRYLYRLKTQSRPAASEP